MSFLAISNVKKVYSGKRNEDIIALANTSMDIEEGEFVTIVGSTGCGKTTLLRLIAGLEIPSAGTISLAKKVADDINSDATMVFQQNSLFPWCSVMDNICFSLELKGLSKSEQVERAQKLISLVGLKGFEKSSPYELSGGMQQRAAIARALAYNPKVLLLDEPFGALDERTRHRLQEELLAIWEREKKTVVLVTHNIDEAIFLASKIFVMRDRPGSIEEEIEVDLPRPRDRRSKEFIDLHIKIREVLEEVLMQNEKGG